ncbi:type II toxin-antitoxin system VapC family toxin [Treponema sp.]|uniref:type II toxin-antitoxin system VapC family toxin n=1 Tax=Treponema sp. TaxID=166 RepID=UPI003FD83E63
MSRKQLIIDASCIMAVIRNEPNCNDIIEKTKLYELLSPECIVFEVGNSLSKLLKRNLLEIPKAQKCFKLFKNMPIKLIEVNFDNALMLSGEEKHYAYDMYYLDCAIRHKVPLLTYDLKLIKIATERGVKCL